MLTPEMLARACFEESRKSGALPLAPWDVLSSRTRRGLIAMCQRAYHEGQKDPPDMRLVRTKGQ